MPAAFENPLKVSVWSDYVCPFCYLELPILERLQSEMGEHLMVEWRAYELRPEPEPLLDPNGAYIHRIWKQAVFPMASDRGVKMNLPPIQPRSRLALEAAEFAREQSRFDEMHRALFKAFFENGQDIGSVDVLLNIGSFVGLKRDELGKALESHRYTKKIRQDQQIAYDIEISGVPALVLSKGHHKALLSGAQPHDALLAAIDQFELLPSAQAV